MYSTKSYELTQDEFNYLLPVLRSKLLSTSEKYYFCGSGDEFSDMLERLKGLYNNYNELKHMIVYKCFIEGNLTPFRMSMSV